MNESTNTQNNFWEDFNELPELIDDKEKNEVFIHETQSNVSKPKINTSDLIKWDFDKQKKIFERLKNSGLQRIIEEKIRTENQTKKEAIPEIKDFIVTLEKKFFDMNDEIIRMHEEMIKVNRDNENLKEKIKSQKLIAAISKKQPQKCKCFYTTTDNSKLLESFKVLEPQIVCLREVLGACKKQSLRGKETVFKLESQLAAMKNDYKSYIENIGRSYIEQESNILKETEEIKQKFDEYKQKSAKEIEIRNIIYNRQQIFIEKLHHDIGVTKFLFNNPTLRTLYASRLKDPESNTRSHSPSLSLSHKRAGLNSRMTKNSDFTEVTTPQTRPVTRERKHTKLKITEDIDNYINIKAMINKRASTPCS
ncbi:hypothetical protein SteCoe_35310 [Stentor coeruleus]|uniref:Uncharacterized protein n=1 Tax=Stentor coeruleus TaxID=5963 RepID=A0A1R2ASL7_9CILI|nr:hypothetical protein SteCoe_35310 [Stentor coeruleus]